MAKGETYLEFVTKFEPKKTTDDCYTPPEIYNETYFESAQKRIEGAKINKAETLDLEFA